MFPGFGDSEGLDQIDDMEDATFHLLDLFERLDVERPILVGSSLGGWMAAELATRYPERVGAARARQPRRPLPRGRRDQGHLRPQASARWSPDLYSDQQHPMAQLMLQFAALAADRDAELPFEMVKPVFQTMAATARLGWDPYLHNPKLRKRLWRVTAPTLVVRGAADTLIPEPHARTYAAEIPGATYREIERGRAHGHDRTA